jgi:hypothetical protein
MVIALFFSMVLAPCVVASVSTHLESKAVSGAVRKAGKSPGEAKI